MSEQEKKSGVNAGGSAVVVVEGQARQKPPPYRLTELEAAEAPDPQLRRTRAPAVAPAVPVGLKSTEESNTSGVGSNVERKESEVLSTEKNKHIVAKILSSTGKQREPHNETLTMAPIEVELRKAPASQPIPPDVVSVTSSAGIPLKMESDEQPDEDSIIEDVAELRTTRARPRHSDWSDEEEAGGLPRSDSRASRVSRGLRQLFCCGMPYEAPSEDNISTSRGYAI